MPRFKSSADILKIVSNKEQIRNIGIIAHVDHGKCVAGDSMVTLSDGGIEEIAQIYDQLKRNGPAATQVDSLNPQTLKMEDKNVSHVWKLHSSKLVKVTLRNGYSVQTTPEHPFYTIATNGTIEQKRADRIGRNDFVLVPNTLRSLPSRIEEIKSEILKDLSSHDYYLVYLEKRFSEKLVQLVGDKESKHVHSSLRTNTSFKAFRGGLAIGRIRMDDLVKITDSLGIPRDEVYDQIHRIAYRLSHARQGRLSNMIKLPRTWKQFEELNYLLGILWGDGSYRASFTNGYRPLLEFASQIFRRVFGVSTLSEAVGLLTGQLTLTPIEAREHLPPPQPSQKSHRFVCSRPKRASVAVCWKGNSDLGPRPATANKFAGAATPASWRSGGVAEQAAAI